VKFCCKPWRLYFVIGQRTKKLLDASEYEGLFGRCQTIPFPAPTKMLQPLPVKAGVILVRIPRYGYFRQRFTLIQPRRRQFGIAHRATTIELFAAAECATLDGKVFLPREDVLPPHLSERHA